MLRKYIELWDKIIEQIELITGDKVSYSKDFMKIRFKTKDDLPLNKIIINIPGCVLIVSSIFKEDGKYIHKFLLHDCYYEYEENIDPRVA